MTPWTAAPQASPSFTVSQSLFRFMSIELMMPSNHLIFCHPLPLPSIFPSIRVFSSESALRIRWPKYWSFSFSLVLPMNIQGWFHWGLIDLISLHFMSKVRSKDLVGNSCLLFDGAAPLWCDLRNKILSPQQCFYPRYILTGIACNSLHREKGEWVWNGVLAYCSWRAF